MNGDNKTVMEVIIHKYKTAGPASAINTDMAFVIITDKTIFIETIIIVSVIAKTLDMVTNTASAITADTVTESKTTIKADKLFPNQNLKRSNICLNQNLKRSNICLYQTVFKILLVL
jgi:hypothetical protein